MSKADADLVRFVFSGEVSASKAQSAIEYLMTYGWMLLVVAIVGGAVFSMVGGQSIESVTGFDDQHFQVTDFGVSGDAGLMFSMNDPLSRTEVGKVVVSGSDGSNVTYILNQDLSENGVVSLPGIMPSESDNELDIEIMYDSGSLQNLSNSGTARGSIEIDSRFNGQKIFLDGLVGYWPLNQRYSDDARVYDLTQNNNHGSVEGDLEWVEDQKGMISRFDGSNSYVDVGYAEAYNLDDEMTVSFRVKFEEGGLTEQMHSFVARGDPDSSEDSEGFWLAYDNREGSERLWFQISDSDDSYGTHPDDRGFKIEEEEFYHFIVMTDANSSYVYINGELWSAADHTGEPVLNIEDPLLIGSESGPPNRVTNSLLDDVRLYDRMLSEEEIAAVYQSDG